MSQADLPASGEMSPAVAGQLVALNQAFYARLAEPFARSRQAPQPGFARLRTYLARPGPALLDVGCGEGRLGRYLWAQQAISAYAGLDFSAALLDQARATVAGQFWRRDLTRPGCLDDLGPFGAIACLSTLQHVPGRGNRQRLVAEMAAHLLPGGLLVTVPVPQAEEIPAAEIEPTIAQAVGEAAAPGLRSAEVTPFLLTRIAELSGARSLRANLALLKNNARVAAEIAVALAG